MTSITEEEFSANTAKYLKTAALGDDFFSVETNSGKAVVISESEWNMMKDFAQICISYPDEILKIIKK